MIWFDLVTPKSVLFFKNIISHIKGRGRQVLVTAREGVDYTEVVGLLKLHNIEFVNRGGFGGANLQDKLRASIERQKELMEFIADHDIDRLVSLCSVDANRVAFGLGMPIINFYDIPLSDFQTNFKRALPQARLTLPLSTRIFKPFVVPDEIFLRFSMDADQIFEYGFIDPVVWLREFCPDFEYVKSTFANLGIDAAKPYIIIREEEYKSSYVAKQYPVLYEALEEIKEMTGANIVIIPRYESGYLRELFPFAYVLEEKIIVQHLLAFSSLFIGGGGTLNTEACYFGTPTISTRSFISHYDKYQIDKGVMNWVSTKEELMSAVDEMFGVRYEALAAEVFDSMVVDVSSMVDGILA
jgi:uncharacterized protein